MNQTALRPRLRRSTSSRRRTILAAASALMFVAPHSPLAAEVVWSSEATSTNWGTGGNWMGGVAPVEGDDVVVSSGHSFNPTNNSSHIGITLNSLTLTGSNSLTLGHPLQIGADGIWNMMSSNSLTLNGVHLAAAQTWGGTRTIFSNGEITGEKLTIDVSPSVRFERNSMNWDGGLEIRTHANMSSGVFAPGTTINAFGTGTITLTNERLSGAASNPMLTLASQAGNSTISTANTLENQIVLQSPSTTSGNFTIGQSQDAADQSAGHFYLLSGAITGNVHTSRTLIFANAKTTAAPATFVLTAANSYSARTRIDANVTVQIGNENTAGSLGTGAVEVNGALNFSRNDRFEFANALSGSGAIRQSGTGTTLLSGNSTHSGDTAVDAGGLYLNGSHNGAGDYLVNATFGGAGQIAFAEGKALSVENGGVIAPGDGEGGVGTLSLDGANTGSAVASFDAGATFLFQLDAAQLQSSRITLLNGAAGDLIFNHNRIDFDVVGGSLTAGQNYQIFEADDSSFFSGLVIDGSGRITSGLELGSGLGGLSGYLSLDSGAISLHVIPEPGTFGLLGAALAYLSLRRRSLPARTC